MFVLSGKTEELSIFFATRSHHPPSCYAAPLNKPKDEDDKAEGIPAINVEEIAKEEEILEEGTKGEDEMIHVKPQLVKFKRVENAECYPINLIFGTPEKKVDIMLGALGRLRNHLPTTACAHQRTSRPLIAMPSLHVGENETQKCAAKREKEAASIIKQEDNCKAAVILLAQSERIELMKIQLFTSTQRETSIGYKNIVELGLGSLIIFKENLESSIFVDFVSAEGQELLVHAEVPPGKDAHDQLFGMVATTPALVGTSTIWQAKRSNSVDTISGFGTMPSLALLFIACIRMILSLLHLSFLTSKGGSSLSSIPGHHTRCTRRRRKWI